MKEVADKTAKKIKTSNRASTNGEVKVRSKTRLTGADETYKSRPDDPNRKLTEDERKLIEAYRAAM